MEKQSKLLYKPPVAEVIEVQTEGTILVASEDQYESIPW